ncbi:MAG: hypothetical protein JO303_14820, partial [Caulobacteraceae bacterium]|nr:hypothetical protein [Caulobacteraceae bacterium]
MPDDYNAALQEAWDSFCDRIKAAGRLAFRKETPDSPLVRAEGVRYMARYISKAMDNEFNFADPLYPQFWVLQTPTNKSFGDNPDCTYWVACADGGNDYRITGNRGTVSWVSFKVGDHVLHNHDLKTEWDGSFVIELSATKKPGNWIKLDPGKQRVFVRQFFGEWDTEEPMRARIERLDLDSPPPPLTPKQVIDGLAATAKWLEEDSAWWPRWVDSFLEHPNTFTSGVPAFTRPATDPGYDGNQALLGRLLNFVGWRIQPDEALVIDVKPPEVCTYWNFELGDRWWNSTDYRYRPSSLNCKQAELASDGTIWAVVSHQDPGIANWLDVGGNIEGSVNQRWVDAT